MIDQQPLRGVRVLDLTRVLAGPFCTMNLADLGAEVIKIEVPGRGDDSRSFAPVMPSGDSGYFYSVNRGKRSITLDLRIEDGAKIFLELAAKSDVVVENFSPGTMDRFKVGYAQLKSANPKIILCSISGFGQTGPKTSAPAYDIVAQALGGTMSITGNAGRRAGAMRCVGRRSVGGAIRRDRDHVCAARARPRRRRQSCRYRDARLPGRDARGRARALLGLRQDSRPARHAASVDHAVPAVSRRRRLLRDGRGQRGYLAPLLRRDLPRPNSKTTRDFSPTPIGPRTIRSWRRSSRISSRRSRATIGCDCSATRRCRARRSPTSRKSLATPIWRRAT